MRTDEPGWRIATGERGGGDVVLYPLGLSTPTSDDLAKQLITTLSVLVTAVASFYFGANSVSGAHKDMASRADGGAVRRRTVR